MSGDAMGARPKSFIASLQALRFLAAAMVLFSHLKIESMHNGVSVGDVTNIPWAAGVDIFFIVSGFIIYFLSRDKFGRPGYVREFVRHRFIRVVPLYWLCTTAFLVVAVARQNLLHQADIGFWRVVGNYLFLPVPRDDGSFFPIFGLGWTLDFEIFFYTLFCLALAMPRRIGLSVMVAILVILSGIGLATRTTLPFLHFYTQPIALEFLFGIGLAQLYVKGVRLGLPIRVVLMAGGFVLLGLIGHLGTDDVYFRPLYVGLPSLMIAAGAVLGTDLPEKGIVPRLLIEGGAASYSLYLTHMFALRLLTIVWTKAGLAAGWVFIVAGFAAAMVLALLCYRYVETPLLALFRGRRRPLPEPAVSAA